jgi:hypothetical protein
MPETFALGSLILLLMVMVFVNLAGAVAIYLLPAYLVRRLGRADIGGELSPLSIGYMIAMVPITVAVCGAFWFFAARPVLSAWSAAMQLLAAAMGLS